MSVEDTGLGDQIERLLAGASRGLAVERLRSALNAGGSPVGKASVVAALRDLSVRGLVEVRRNRKWHLRGAPGPRGATGATEGAAPGNRYHALRATVIHGAPAVQEADLPAGRITADLSLLRRLLPYYQTALKTGDAGSPTESLERYGERFVFLRPDRPWWPTASHGRRLRIARHHMPPALLERVSKHSGRKLLLGYPTQLVMPRGDDARPFLRPIATFQCAFEATEAAIELTLLSTRPTLNRGWLRDQKQYARWDPSRLRSFLLFEDEDTGIAEEDDLGSPVFLEVPALASRVDAALKTSVRGALDPAAVVASISDPPETGIFNALVLMTDDGGKYTRSAIRDYDQLMALDELAFTGTAAASLFDTPAEAMSEVPLLNPFPMNETQLVATRAALTGPTTVITGPPGTGKSQVIAALMISAAAAGRSVLFAARQHRALDAVQERIQVLAVDRVVLVRANEGDGGAGFTFSDAVQALLGRPDAKAARQRFRQAYNRLADDDRERWRVLDQWRALALLTERAARAREVAEDAQTEVDRLTQAADAKGVFVPDQAPQGLPGRLLSFLRILWPFARRPLFGTAWALHTARRVAAEREREMSAAEAAVTAARIALGDSGADPVVIGTAIEERSRSLLPKLLDALEELDEQGRQRLTELVGDHALKGGQSRMALPEEAARRVLAHFPLWAVTTLAAGSRIPLSAGLFDYVVFDEAAQTDIASALPLLFRARAAVIVGDPQQLTMISTLDPREERDLLREQDALRDGIGRFAQGRTTLFDLAATASPGRRFLLTDHFRCHPEIAGYINEAFYGRRLTTLTDTRRLNVPRGYKPGLHWTDVSGPVHARNSPGQSGSAASASEADTIGRLVRDLAGTGYEGSIGVVAFFDYQAGMIADRLRSLPQAVHERHNLKIFTATKFQGDERDVIFFSLCMAPGMPAGARLFIERERRLLNVAVSRARAICHVVGDLTYAAGCGIRHVETLARRYRQSQSRIEPRFDDRFDSPWERRLYQALVAQGVDPTPQYAVAGRFLDLALIDETRSPPRRLDIEVDGVTYHTDEDGDRLASDLWRDHQIGGLGWQIMRFWVHELRDNMGGCVDRILEQYRA